MSFIRTPSMSSKPSGGVFVLVVRILGMVVDVKTLQTPLADRRTRIGWPPVHVTASFPTRRAGARYALEGSFLQPRPLREQALATLAHAITVIIAPRTRCRARSVPRANPAALLLPSLP